MLPIGYPVSLQNHQNHTQNSKTCSIDGVKRNKQRKHLLRNNKIKNILTTAGIGLVIGLPMAIGVIDIMSNLETANQINNLNGSLDSINYDHFIRNASIAGGATLGTTVLTGATIGALKNDNHNDSDNHYDN